MNANKIKVLFFTDNDPLYGKGGENLRTRSALQILSVFCSIKVIAPTYTASIDENIMSDIKSKLHLIPVKQIKKNTSKTKPTNFIQKIISNYNAYFNVDSHYIKEMENLIKEHKFQLAWIDSAGFLGQYICFLKKNGMKIIYNTHNIQSYLNFSLKRNNILSRLKSLILEVIHECLFFRKCDYLCYCSKKEKSYYSKIVKKEKLFYLPNVSSYEDTNDSQVHSLPKKYLLWTGTMYVSFHREGVLFFIKNVWPHLLKKYNDLNFVIAGRKAALLAPDIKKTDNIQIYDTPENIEIFFKNALIAIVPVFWGSGTKIKILDAMKAGVPVITAKKEAQLFGFEDKKELLTADTKNEFITKIDLLLNNQDLRKKIISSALEAVKTKYSNEAIFEVVKKNIFKICS